MFSLVCVALTHADLGCLGLTYVHLRHVELG